MIKVNQTRGYEFDSVDYKTPKLLNSGLLEKYCNEFNELLENEIQKLEERVEELKEVRSLISKNKQFYLFKDNDSKYFYVDSNGTEYRYIYSFDKPILIGEDMSIYEIISYSETNNIYEYNYKKSHLYVDKIVNAVKIK